MRVRSAVGWLPAVLLISHGQAAFAQADAHARAIARASCQADRQSAAVMDARAALEREPEELGVRMRLADALVDQGCYQEAVEILEAGQESHPRNAELAGKLRDVRSLVTEQTYIEGLTQAAEGAKFQRNQLRCTRLADIGACDDALRFKPDDVQLTLARGDALMQANRPADAVTAYERASQLSPGDEAVRNKLAAAEALQASLQPPPAPESQAVASNTNTTPAPKAAKRAPMPGTSVAGAQAAGAASGPSSVQAGAGPTSGAGTVAASGPRPARSSSPGATAAPAKPSLLASAGAPTLSDTGSRPLHATAQSSLGQHLATTPVATMAALEPPETKIYSNDAPPGRSN
jgi:tetratricopeptide (TPR) repeat protein